MSFHETTSQSSAKLMALDPTIRPEQYSLTGDGCTIGRAPTCEVMVSRAAVSRVHARIERRGTYFVLIDLKSANGTFVNGRQIREEYVLRNQDQIGLANRQSLIQFNDLEATDLTPRKLHFVKREQRFTFNNIPLDLSPNLTRLLMHLYSHVGDVCSRESCIQAIWNDASYDPERIELLYKEISELRQKFQALDPLADIVKSRRGIRYYLDIDL